MIEIPTDKKSFILYNDYIRYFSKLTNEQIANVMQCIFAFNNGNKEELKHYESKLSESSSMLWELIQANFEREIVEWIAQKEYREKRRAQKREYDKKAKDNQGQPRTVTDSDRQPRTVTDKMSINNNINIHDNVNDNVNAKVNENVNANGNENVIVFNKENKVKEKLYLGKFANVCVTELEKQKLNEELSEEIANKTINELSIYMESKGKHYKNHYATLLSFAKRNAERKAFDNSQNETMSAKTIKTAERLGVSL